VVIVPSLQDPDLIRQKFPEGYVAITPVSASYTSTQHSLRRWVAAEDRDDSFNTSLACLIDFGSWRCRYIGN